MLCSCITSPNWLADKDHCRPTLAFHVDVGEIEGLDVSGKTVVMVTQTPAVMTDVAGAVIALGKQEVLGIDVGTSEDGDEHHR